MATPKPNGSIMPARAIEAERRQLRLITPASISRPTKKRKRQRPILAVKLRNGSDESGKMCSVKLGMRPRVLRGRNEPRKNYGMRPSLPNAVGPTK